MADENPTSHQSAPIGEYHLALCQLDRFLFGVLGDVTLSPEEIDPLRRAIRDPDSAIGKRARQYHQELGKVLNEQQPMPVRELTSSSDVS